MAIDNDGIHMVTGGAGFIGSHLVQELLQMGRRVRVLEHPAATVAHLPIDQIELIRGDIRDRQAVQAAVAGCQTVYHLAANPNLWTRCRADFDAVNHQGTKHVLESALAAGVQRVLHCSTESILTSRSFQGGAVETKVLSETDMVGPYCLSKFHAEQFAWRLADSGAPVVLANPTIPVGPGDRNLSPPTRMTLAFCQGQLPAYLDCQMNFIDVRDVARGLRLVLDQGRTGRRYLLGFENLRLVEWLTLVGQAIGKETPRWRVPYYLALAVAYGSEWWADWVSGHMPQATVTGVRLTRYNMHFDPSASLQELGLTPRPLTESIRDAIAWYRQQGWLPTPA